MNKTEIGITGIFQVTHNMVCLLYPASTTDLIESQMHLLSHMIFVSFIIDEDFSATTRSYSPHCQAEQRRRLQRRRIWPWGRDRPPGRAPASRLPDPSAAWSGSRSLDGQEMTVKGGKKERRGWDENWRWRYLLPFRILFKEKKGGFEEKGDWIRERRKKPDCSVDLLRGTDPNIRQVVLQ